MAAEIRGRSSEQALLDQLLEDARAGQSAVLVIRGEAGVGKTALLRYAAEQASGFRVAQIAGVESEMELAYAGLHQLCAPMLDRLDALPSRSRRRSGSRSVLRPAMPPDRFLVALATLGLLSAAAEERPLLCVIDDLQWLDDASAQALGFVARRLLAEPVALVFAVREPAVSTTGRPAGAGAARARRGRRARVARRPPSPAGIDERVRDRILAETHGNPLALLELPRGMTAAELAGGFAPPPASGRPALEDGFRRRLDALPADTRRLLQLAAADPVGEPLLVWRAAERLGIHPEAATPALEAGCWRSALRFASVTRCVRSAAYRSASAGRALRAARGTRRGHRCRDRIPTGARGTARRRHLGPTRRSPRSWNARRPARRHAAASRRPPRSSRRAATLTPDPADRVRRLLAAARAKRDAGALDAALRSAERRRGRTAVGRCRPRRSSTCAARSPSISAASATPRGCSSAPPGDWSRSTPELARTTHLEALGAAIWAADLDSPGALLEAPRPPAPRRPRPTRPTRWTSCSTRWRSGSPTGYAGGRAGAASTRWRPCWRCRPPPAISVAGSG